MILILMQGSCQLLQYIFEDLSEIFQGMIQFSIQLLF